MAKTAILKTALTVSAVLLSVLSGTAFADGTYSGGTGEPNDPYLIATPADMNEIGIHPNDWNDCFLLTADINLIDYNETNFNIIGNSATKFTGVFDGNDHTISNFTWKSADANYVGLFSVVKDPNAKIKDVRLIDSNVQGNECVGALVGLFLNGTITGCGVEGGTVSGYITVGGLTGYNWQDCTISNCYVTGDVLGHARFGGLTGDNRGVISNCYATVSISGYARFGGLVGCNYGTISNCYATGNISGDYYTGGLTGQNFDGTISNCYATGNVSGDYYAGGLTGENYDSTILNCYATGSVSGINDVGGLAGLNYNGTISNCYAIGSVSGINDVGGLAGLNYDGTISNCYAIGNVSGDYCAGGLTGLNYNGTISNCYATGSVTGTSAVGGLAGFHWNSTISNCYAAGSVLGWMDVGGLVGKNDYADIFASFWDTQTTGWDNGVGYNSGTGTVEVYGRTTAQMQTQVIFTDYGWDFVGETANGPNDIWKICEGYDYPKLKWEKYCGGSGASETPYLICLPEELQTIGANPGDWDKHFKLMADIDLSSYTGTQFNIIGTFVPPALFTGTFDGNGHKISNFTYKSPDADYIGIFGAVGGEYTETEIKNLTLVDPNVDVGLGGYVGPLVGFWYKVGTLSDCAVIGGSVKGIGAVGGLLGRNMFGNIIRCSSSADVTATATEFGPAGGLIGINNFGSVGLCYSAGDVTSNNVAGGLIGSTDSGSSTTNCYSTATVTGPDFVGGLVGYNISPITNCYAVGIVSGPGFYVSGLVGGNSGPVTASFWDVNTSGQPGPWAGTGLTTLEMQTEDTFTTAGWDFVDETANGPNDFWKICEGTNYPKLAWQIPLPGDFVCPDGVEMNDLAVLVEQWLLEKLSADISSDGGDGFVDFLDWAVFANAWQSTGEPPSANWNPKCDIAPAGGDDVVDIDDLAVFVGQWLQFKAYCADIAPPPDGDGVVNMLDFAMFADNWLQGL